MKIFEFKHEEDRVWIYAKDEAQAVEEFNKDVKGAFDDEFDEGYEIVEIPEDQWDSYYVSNPEYVCQEDIDEGMKPPEDNWEKVSFRDWIGEATSPFAIASTIEW